MTIERWRAIPGYEGRYEASNMGQVRSLDCTVADKRGARRSYRGQILKPIPHPRDEYLQVSIPKWRNRKGLAMIHQIVLETFVGPRPSPQTEACHANDVRTDNRLSNLRWDTKTANAQDAVVNMRFPQQWRTECPQGHKYTPENTRIKPSEGRRRCIACINIYERARRARARRARLGLAS